MIGLILLFSIIIISPRPDEVKGLIKFLKNWYIKERAKRNVNLPFLKVLCNLNSFLDRLYQPVFTYNFTKANLKHFKKIVHSCLTIAIKSVFYFKKNKSNDIIMA